MMLKMKTTAHPSSARCRGMCDGVVRVTMEIGPGSGARHCIIPHAAPNLSNVMKILTLVAFSNGHCSKSG